MTEKTKIIISWSIKGLLTLMFAFSAFGKLSGSEEVSMMFEAFRLTGYKTMIGIIELICTVLYLIPRTSSLGTLLLTSYMGGAIVAHMTVGDPFIFQGFMILFIWIGQYLVQPSLIDSFKK